jgi:hypothetical protein
MKWRISNCWRCENPTLLEFAHDFFFSFIMLCFQVMSLLTYALTWWHGKHIAAPPSTVFVTFIENIFATSSTTLMLRLLWPSCNFWNAQLKVYESFRFTEWKKSCLDCDSVHLCINVTPLESDPYIQKRKQEKWCTHSGLYWKISIENYA